MSHFEAFAWYAGGALLATYAGTNAYFAHERRDAIEVFLEKKQRLQIEAGSAEIFLADLESEDEAGDDTERAPAPNVGHSLAAPTPDTRLWSASRVDRYAARQGAASPRAILRIEDIELEVPIFDGTSELNLNQGAGVIEGTAPVGTAGNTGIAAHRDGYFRSLERVDLGDRVEIETLTARYTYLVDEIRIVDPQAVEVLAPSERAMVTLVTCYPFYFIGPAPQRFVVRATLR